MNSFKRHICDVKNSQVGHDLAISTNDREISSFGNDFIFTKLCIRKNKTLAKVSEFTVLSADAGMMTHCKFGNFCENLIYVKSVKRHNFHVKKSLLGYILPTSVHDRLFSPFSRDFIFTKL